MSTLLSLKRPIAEKIVQTSDGELFAVRGLTPFHVVSLYKRHAGELEPLFQRVIAGAKQAGETQDSDIEAIVLSLAADAPIILAELLTLGTGGDPANLSEVTIAHPATGEDTTLPSFDAAALLAQHLPFPVQVDAVAKIGELTFTTDMPPGKFFALVTKLAQAVTGAMKGLGSPTA